MNRVRNSFNLASTRKTASALLPVALLGYLLVFMTFRLASFPGLHGDEAWAGLRAMDVLQRKFFDIHGMNLYSGSLFGYLVALVFKVAGPSVLGIRIVSVAFNILALLAFCIYLRRRFGIRSFSLFTVLVSGSAMLLLYARLGWEICALNFFLTVLLLIAAEKMLARRVFSGPTLLLFFAAMLVGCLNHFLFISMVLTFFIASMLIAVVGRGREHTMGFFLLNLVNIGFIFIIYKANFALTDPLVIEKLKVPIILGLSALPFIEVAVYHGVKKLLDVMTNLPSAASLMKGKLLQSRIGKYSRPAFLGLSMIAAAAFSLGFVYYHGQGLWGTLSGTMLMRRLFSVEPSIVFKTPAAFFAAALLTVYFLVLTVTIRRSMREETNINVLFMTLLPLLYACVLVFMTRFSSLRYSMLLVILLFASLSVAAPGVLLGRERIAFLLTGLVFAAALHGAMWKNLLSDEKRPPLEFRIGNITETSAHFDDTRPLYEHMKSRNFCNFAADDNSSLFIVRPLLFYKQAENYTCDNETMIYFSYCEMCRVPSGYKIEAGK